MKFAHIGEILRGFSLFESSLANYIKEAMT